MFCYKRNNRARVLKGLQIDDPMIFLPWDIDENVFVDIFKNHNVSLVVRKHYFVRDVTIFSENHCNIGIIFDRTICKVSIARDNYEGYDAYVKSFVGFQTALTRDFGRPNRCEKTLNDFENCEWELSANIKIHHYVINRFGLEEHLYITHS
jgi:hypothetical protein